MIRGAGKALKGLGNVFSGRASVDAVLRGAERWLGPAYREISPGIFRSTTDSSRQFRMADVDITHNNGPHAHFESIGPDGRKIVENGHVYFEP